MDIKKYFENFKLTNYYKYGLDIVNILYTYSSNNLSIDLVRINKREGLFLLIWDNKYERSFLFKWLGTKEDYSTILLEHNCFIEDNVFFNISDIATNSSECIILKSFVSFMCGKDFMAIEYGLK